MQITAAFAPYTAPEAVNPGDAPVLAYYIADLGLNKAETRLPFEGGLHNPAVLVPVRLRSERVDGRALSAVQHPVLYGCSVRRLSHLAAEAVELAHEVALRRSAYRGVAGHIAHRVKIDGKAYHPRTEPCGGQSGLDPGMARADYGDVAVASVVFRMPYLLSF